MRIKRKGPPLGSGLYEMPQDPAPMALGSGLFGIGIPPAAEQQYSMPEEGWVSAEGGAGYAGGQPMDVAPPRAVKGDGGGMFGDGFEQLLSDPKFILGLNLLGASNNPNPWGTALNDTLAAMSRFGKGKREQRLLELDEARMAQARALADLEHERGLGNLEVNRQNAATARRNAELDARKLDLQAPYYEAQAVNMGAQADLERQKLEQSRRRMEMEQQILREALGAQAPMAPVGAGAGGVGTHGTPSWLLDSLAQVESSGNPGAVNPESGAQGLYQFMPGTVDMLAKKGVRFDPFDARQSRDAADYYLQDLLKSSGGDYKKALAAYGGFVTKDPTRYVEKVMQGAPPATPGQAPGYNQERDIRLGVAASAINPQLGSAIQQGVRMRADQAHREREYGYKERELARGERGMALQEVQEARQADKSARERGTELADLDNTYRQAVDSMERTGRLAGELINHKGLDAYEGLSGLAGLHKLTQAGRDAEAKFESLKSRLVVDTMKSLKEMSSTGSSGFGSLSNQENMRLETFVTNLKAAQSKEQLQEALKDIRDWSRNAVDLHRQRYEEVRGAYGEKPVRRQETPSASPTRQQGFERVSPREVKGSIKPAAPAGVKFLGFE